MPKAWNSSSSSTALSCFFSEGFESFEALVINLDGPKRLPCDTSDFVTFGEATHETLRSAAPSGALVLQRFATAFFRWSCQDASWLPRSCTIKRARPSCWSPVLVKRRTPWWLSVGSKWHWERCSLLVGIDSDRGRRSDGEHMGPKGGRRSIKKL